jgi:hypothetical protein
MELLPDDILGIILSYLPRDGTNSCIHAILTCKKWKHVYLTKVLPPWKIFLIYTDTDYCGLMGSFDVNEYTVNKEYFYHWYSLFPTSFKKDFLLKYGDYFFHQSCSLNNEEDKKEMVIFFIKEFISYNIEENPKLTSSAIEHVLYEEDIHLAYIIFIDYCFIPINKKILKKWCTILCHKREYPKEKNQRENRETIIRWIKNRPEMTKYRIKGKDYFSY